MEKRQIKNADLATASAANGGEPATFAQVQAEIEAALAAGELSSLPQKFALFERKLRAALTDSSVTASELAALMQETERACAAAADCSAAEAEKALDPTQYPDPVAARNVAESAAFMANRLKTMQPRLAAHFEKAYAAEQLQTYLAKLRELAPP